MAPRKIIKICRECKSEFHSRRGKYCSVTCSSKQISKPEVREKISKGRKKFLKENPDKHPWKRNDKFISDPCERFKDFLNNINMPFIEEYRPLNDRYFSIDIAFPDIMVGIEINGNQHYDKNGNLKSYYKDRHDIIVSEGWDLLEVHYSNCYNINSMKDIIEKLESPDPYEYFKIKRNRDLKKKEDDTLPLGMKQRLISDQKWKPYKERVINSGIDFSRFGWVNKVSDILGIRPQKVNAWMKRYLPEIYEKECFKRNR